MEIQMIARLSDASITSLAHPSIFELGGIYPRRRFLQWGALLLAFMYALGSLARRVKILFFQRRRSTSKLSSNFDSFEEEDDVVSSSDEEEEDDVVSVDDCASCSSHDDGDQGGIFYDDFPSNENPFSLVELVNGKGVVKLWDGLGLGLNLTESPSIQPGDLDLDRSAMIGSIVGRLPALSVSPSSPEVVLTAFTGGDGRVGIRSWDMRLRRRKPTVEAEWRLDHRAGPVLEVEAGGVDKVFLRDGVSRKMTVGDMRKANFPLVEVTEYDGSGWFDASNVTETEG